MAIHKQGTQHIILVGIGIVAFLIGGFTLLTGPLVFEDDRFLAITWEQLSGKNPVTVQVCNIGAAGLESIRVALTGFNFMEGEKPVADDIVLQQPTITTPLDAGACNPVSLTAKTGGVEPDPGAYTGQLVVSSPGVDMIRREVIIQVGPPAPSPTPTPQVGPPDPAPTPTPQVGPLAFRDGDALTITWGQVISGVDVNVCNEGNGPLQSFEAVLSGFNFRVEKKFVPIGDVLQLPPNFSTPLEAGKCTLVNLKALDGKTPDPGKYEGALILSQVKEDGTTARKSLKITLNLDPVKAVAGDTVMLTGTRKWFRWVKLDFPYLLLKPAGPGETFTPPEEGAFLGVIYGQGRSACIFVDGDSGGCARKDCALVKDGLDRSAPLKGAVLGRSDTGDYPEQGGFLMLPMRVEGLNRVGTYSGELNVYPADSSQAAIKVQLDVKDNFIWAVVAILFGVGVSFLVLLWLQRWRWTNQLKGRRYKVQDGYEAAGKSFHAAYADGSFVFKDFDAPGKPYVDAYLSDFNTALNSYRRDNWLFETDSADFKAVNKMLVTAEDDIKCIWSKDESPLGKSLEALLKNKKILKTI